MSRVTDKALRVALEQAKSYADRTRPTKLSELTNDNHTVVDAGYVHTDNNYTDSDKAKLASASSAMANKVDKEAGKGLSSEDFTAALKAKLEALSNYDDSAIQAKANALQEQLDTLTSGETSKVIETFNAIEELLRTVNDTETLTGLLQEQKAQSEQYVKDNAVLRTEQTLTAAEQAQVLANLGNPQMRHLITRWNQAWRFGNWQLGQYNEQTGLFEGNGVTGITAEQALRILDIGQIRLCEAGQYNPMILTEQLPTLLPVTGGLTLNLHGALRKCDTQVVRFVNYYSTSENSAMQVDSTQEFALYSTIREVKGILNVQYDQSPYSHFYNAGLGWIETIWVKNICKNLNLRYNNSIRCECLAYMVANAANTKAITITVHQDVYAKLTDESNTEWYQVLTDAQAKNINFATV